MMPKAASDREERSYDPVLASESDEEYDEDSLSSDGGSRAPARSRAGGRGKGMSTSRHAQQSVQPPKRRRRQPDDPEKKNIRREKNREAARRCRKRKLDIVQDLECQVSVALDEYINLERQAAALQALLASQLSSQRAMESFIKAHGTQRLDASSPTPLSAEAVLMRNQLLEEVENPGNNPGFEITGDLWAGQAHGISASHFVDPHNPAGLPLSPKDAGQGSSRGMHRRGPSARRATQKQPHHAAACFPDVKPASTAPAPDPPPPPALSFDFPLPSAAPHGSTQTHGLPPLHLSMPPPASPFAAFAATPTHNLKLLADQAMQKLLYPSPLHPPYIRPTTAGIAPFPPFQNDQHIPGFLLASPLEQDSNLFTSPRSSPGSTQPPRTLKAGQAASKHQEQSAGMRYAAPQPLRHLSCSTPPGTKELIGSSEAEETLQESLPAPFERRQRSDQQGVAAHHAELSPTFSSADLPGFVLSWP